MNIHLDWSVNLVQQIDKSISRCACESSEEFMQNQQCQLNMSCFYYSSLWLAFSCYFIFFNQFQLNEHWTEKKSCHFIFACIRWNTLYSDFQHLFLSCEMLSQFSWLRCVSWCLYEMTPKYDHIWYTHNCKHIGTRLAVCFPTLVRKCHPLCWMWECLLFVFIKL